ncbi:MAG: hypothetical protein AB7O74_05520 [Candidatus Nanopelagicales bacterium]
MVSASLAELVRWEESGGAWELVSDAGGIIVLALLPCTGGDPVGSIESRDSDLREHVGR